MRSLVALLFFLSFSAWAQTSNTVPALANQKVWKVSAPGGSCKAKTAMEAAEACLWRWQESLKNGQNANNCLWTITASIHRSTSDGVTPWLRKDYSGGPIPGLNMPCTATRAPEYDPIGSSWSMDTLCPANSEFSAGSTTVCSCKAGFKVDEAGTACKIDCTANAVSSSGYYDIGPTAGASPKLLACAKKCETVFDGTSPSGSALVNGKKHWFAKGQYINTGNQCSATHEAQHQIENGKTSIPEDTCSGTDAKGTINGKVVCVPQIGDPTKPTPETENKATKTTEKTRTTNPDGSVSEVETTTEIDSDGNKKVTKTTTTTKPDGSVSTKTEIVNGGKWSAGTDPDKPGDDGKGEDGPDEEKGRCEKNPSEEGCGGNPASIGDLYQAKDKTVRTVLAEHSATLASSPIGSAVSGFFQVATGGSCPTFSAAIPFLKTDIKFDQFCTPMGADAIAALKVCLLIVASFFAFRVAIE